MSEATDQKEQDVQHPDAQEAQHKGPYVPTKEEIAEMREKQEAFYDEQIEMLVKAAEYHELKAVIAEAKYREYSASVRHAQLAGEVQQAEQAAKEEFDKAQEAAQGGGKLTRKLKDQ